MSNVYYWDFGFDFLAGKVTNTGLVWALGGSENTALNITDKCRKTPHGISWYFQEGDVVNVNIFDVTIGGQATTLLNGSLYFMNVPNSPFGNDPNPKFTLGGGAGVLGSEGGSAAFGGPFPQWLVFTDQKVVNDGQFDFIISLNVQQGTGSPKVIDGYDPEMIVGGATKS